MKKLFLFFVFTVLVIQFSKADNVIVMDAKELPMAAQTFLRQHFSDKQISYIKVEKEFLSKRYEVMMTDRTKIEFDGKGNWEEVDGKHNHIPRALVPDYIRQFVDTQYPDANYVKIERDRGEVEINLSNWLSLKFNKKGQLIDIDEDD